MQQDLTQGSIRAGLIRFSLPLIAGNLLQQLYNVADTLIVGRFLGNVALAAVGSAFSLMILLTSLVLGLCMGSGVVFSQLYGEGNMDKLKTAMTNAFCLIAALSLLLTVLSYAMLDAFIVLLRVPPEAVPDITSYLRVIFAGIFFTFLYNFFAAALRSVGNSLASLLFLLLSTVVNIALDLLFVLVLRRGVAGAALATVLSQAVGAAWIIRFLTGKKTILRLRRDYLRPEKQIILPVLALGISSFVMLSTESLLSISFSSSLARYGGDVAVGAMTVITSASQLCTLPIQGICQGGQPVMSFNFGAGKKARVKEAFRFQLTLCGAYTCLFWLLMMLFPGAVAGIFTSDTALIQYTTWAMRIYMAGIFAMGFQIACQQSFMALGQAKVSLLLACLRKIILLIPLIFILPHVLPDAVFGVFLAEPVSDILAATITTITFFARFDKILDRGAAHV